MSTLLVFLQIQALASVVVAAVLWYSMRRSVRRIIEKNCRRLDGTYSERRKLIELQSLNRAGLSIVGALLFLFAITILFGMLIVGLTFTQIEWRDFETPNPEWFSPRVDQAVVDFLNKWQWQLIATYVVILFVFFPLCLSYAYQHALQKYRRRANLRFQQYYQQEWLNASEDAKRKLVADRQPIPVSESSEVAGGA
ncbi:MAG: hypothetical protein ABL888_15570 [Pirellulaceae bacterium]